jgi:hypothetical protein
VEAGSLAKAALVGATNVSLQVSEGTTKFGKTNEGKKSAQHCPQQHGR